MSERRENGGPAGTGRVRILLGYGTCAIGLFCVLWGALFISVAYEALGIFLGIVGFALGARRPGTATVVISAVALILVPRPPRDTYPASSPRIPGQGTRSQEEPMAETNNEKRIAIACQGGGSHTAFTAGVLKILLGAEELSDYKVVGLSGTSGGAICALLAWHNLLRGDAAGAVRDLDAFWHDNSATAPMEQVVNNWTVWAANLQDYVATPAISPYDNYFANLGLEEFRKMLKRRVDFQGVHVQPEGTYPALLVGAVDVLTGEFRAFNSRRDRISAGTILASAAIPTLFRSVRLPDGGTYWDGLFSQNPPVRELTDEGPDEIWVIQINPRERKSVRRRSPRLRTGVTSSPATSRCTRSLVLSRRSTRCWRRATSIATASTSRSWCA